MTISSEVRKAGPYTGNGVTTAFPFAFKVFSADDVVVIQTNTAGVETTLTYTDYGITLNPDQDAAPGGTVNMVSAPAADYLLTITSRVQNLQPLELTNQGGFYPTTINDALDRLTILSQQNSERIGRSVKVAISSGVTEEDATLPTSQPNTVMAWNSTGTALVNLPLQVGTSLVDLSSYAGSSLVGFSQSGSGAVARTVQAKGRDIVSVRDFGALGDGVTDDTAAINAANAYAASIGANVIFTEGTYLCNGIAPTTSWRGFGATIKNNVSGTQVITGFCSINAQSNLHFSGLTFDGNVSADPGAWGPSNYDTFTGAIACFVINSTDVHFDECLFRNSVSSPFRGEASTGLRFSRCKAERGRGNFGDGFYLTNCSDVEYSQCDAEDVTRIGFVTEAGSFDVTCSQCTARHMHDSSVLYGGTEYSAGFWSENSADMICDGCRSYDSVHYGFVSTTGTVTGKTRAAFSFTNCFSYDAVAAGYLCSSIAGLPTDVTLTGCHSYGSTKGFKALANNDSDTFTHIGCHVLLTFSVTSTSDISYMWESLTSHTNTPTFSYTDCTIAHLNPDAGALADIATNTGDLSCFSGGKADIHVTRMTNVDSTKPIIWKARTGGDNANFTISQCNISGIKVGEYHSITMSECTIPTLIQNTTTATGTVTLYNCDVAGPVNLNMLGRFTMRGGTILPGVDYLYINRTISSLDALVEFDGVRVAKDINTSDYAIRVQENGASKPNCIFRNMTWFNTGTATAVETFTWIENAGTVATYQSCLYDSTVTYVQKLVATLSTPAGNTALTMH